MLVPFFTTFNIDLPFDRGLELAVLPATFAQTFKVGEMAEIANIAIYERFLQQALPEQVRVIFERLRAGSESHLRAFTR